MNLPLLLQLGLPLSYSTLWLIGGITLLGLSFLIPRPTITAMGIAAILTGLAALAIPSPTIQVILWAALVGLGAIVLRWIVPPNAETLEKPTEARVSEKIPVGGEGQVEYEGTTWSARCQNPDLAIASEQTVNVVDREGTTLIVIPSTFARQDHNIAESAD